MQQRGFMKIGDRTVLIQTVNRKFSVFFFFPCVKQTSIRCFAVAVETAEGPFSTSCSRLVL